MSNKTHFQAAINSEFDAQLKALKTSLGVQTNTELLEFLVNYHKSPFRSDLTLSQKVERWVQSSLLNPNQKVTTHTAKQHFLISEKKQINTNTISDVLELYKAEIEAHNAKFE